MPWNQFRIVVCAAAIVAFESAAPITRAADAATIDSATAKQHARWIWMNGEGGNPAAERVAFRRKFEVACKVKSAEIVATCDNRFELFLNGNNVLTGNEWTQPVRKDVTKELVGGNNILACLGRNEGSAAGLLVVLSIEATDGTRHFIATGDDAWRAALKPDGKWKSFDFDDAAWSKPNVVAGYGEGPWKDVLAAKPSGAAASDAVFHTLPGFEVDSMFSVPQSEMGSWVAITFDHRGRLIASDQGDKGLFRITPPPAGSNEPAKVEKLDVQISSAHGMLYAFDALYLSVNGGPGSGLYRARDTDGDDQFDEVVKLKEFAGAGEHGPHGLVLSPDGKRILCIGGNHTKPPYVPELNSDVQTMGGVRPTQLRAKLPAGVTSTLQPNWDEDVLLPRQWDANGHATGVLAPGGWIAATDPDGKTWEMLSVGYRNQYDMAYNADGELFAYDSDMEWDMGTPWYRPTTVTHAVSGSEFGWRSGTARWPPYYVDSLPPLLNIGPGSPVGVAFGYGAKFPAKYQKALYICDWTFGTMYALHLEPQGATYRAVKEEFVARTPLPLTDVAIGPDGCMYFTVGGRGTQSELFRVRYVGKEPTTPADAHDAAFAELRALRHKIETYHRPASDPKQAVEFLVPQLAHEDRNIRYAARVALEFQPLELWQDQVLASNDPDTVILGVAALARQGDKPLQPKLLAALDRLEFSPLGERLQLNLLRAYQLVFIRLGEPDDAARARLATKLDAHFPAASDPLNKELSTLLVFLKSPTIIGKVLAEMEKPSKHETAETAELLGRNDRYGGTIATMLANHPDLMQLHYAFVLRNVKEGWTLDDRRAYFGWFEKARTWSGGASFQGFLRNIDGDAYANASEKDKALIDTFARKPIVPAVLPKPKGPGRDWKLEEILELTKDGLKRRNYENGKSAFAASRCIVCHRIAGEGGATGPDLTQLAGRFSIKDLTEAIVNPNKVISDQYRASIVETTAGQSYTGRIVSENEGVLTIVVNPEDATKIVHVKKSEIESLAPSPVSLMPADLLKPLNQDEVLDMLAFMLSRGDRRSPMFKK